MSLSPPSTVQTPNTPLLNHTQPQFPNYILRGEGFLKTERGLGLHRFFTSNARESERESLLLQRSNGSSKRSNLHTPRSRPLQLSSNARMLLYQFTLTVVQKFLYHFPQYKSTHITFFSFALKLDEFNVMV